VLADDVLATQLVLEVSRLLAAITLSAFPTTATANPTQRKRSRGQVAAIVGTSDEQLCPSAGSLSTGAAALTVTAALLPVGSAKQFDGGGARPRACMRGRGMAQSGHGSGALRISLLSAS
jgi:hypothetical protein